MNWGRRISPVHLLACLCLTGCIAAPDIQLAAPTGSGPVSLAIVELEQARFIDFLEFPKSEERPEGEIATLFEHQATVKRVVAGRWLASRIRVRRVWPSLAHPRDGWRRFAVLERTGSRYFHIAWDTHIDRGRTCIPANVIEHYRLSVADRSPGDKGEICFTV